MNGASGIREFRKHWISSEFKRMVPAIPSDGVERKMIAIQEEKTYERRKNALEL